MPNIGAAAAYRNLYRNLKPEGYQPSGVDVPSTPPSGGSSIMREDAMRSRLRPRPQHDADSALAVAGGIVITFTIVFALLMGLALYGCLSGAWERAL
jgi:hypothetical protein